MAPLLSANRGFENYSIVLVGDRGIGGAEVETRVTASQICFALLALDNKDKRVPLSLSYRVCSQLDEAHCQHQNSSDFQMSLDQSPCTTTHLRPQIHLVYNTNCPTHTSNPSGQEHIIQSFPIPYLPQASHRALSLQATVYTPMAQLLYITLHSSHIRLPTHITNITTPSIKYSPLPLLQARMPSRYLYARVLRHQTHRLQGILIGSRK